MVRSPSARSRAGLATALLTLLLAAGLAGVPGADAQISIGYPAGYDRLGWTFPEGTFPGGEATDAAGDVVLESDAGAVPVGATDTQRALDMTRLRVDEPDAETLRIQLDVAALDTQRDIAGNVFFGISYDILFTVDEDRYRIEAMLWYGCGDGAPAVCTPLVDPVQVLPTRLYRLDDTGGSEMLGAIPGRALTEDDRVEVLVPRWALNVKGPAAAPLLGSIITDIQAASSGTHTCFTQPGVCTAMTDRLPDDGSLNDLHAVTIDSHGARLRVEDQRAFLDDAFDDNRFRELRPRFLLQDIAGTGSVQVPVPVKNLMDRKLLVTPTVEVLEGDFTASVPETFEAPGRSTATMLLTINLTKEIPMDTRAIVRLHLATIGTDPVYTDVSDIHLRSIAVLGPETNKLYLHTRQYESGLAVEDVDPLAFHENFLNTAADDPEDIGEGPVLHDFCFCINRAYGWYGETGVATPVYLDNETNANLHLVADAPLPGRLEVNVLLYLGDRLVADGAHQIEIQDGRHEHDVPLHIDEEALLLEPGSGDWSADLMAYFRPANVPLSELAGVVEHTNPRLVTGGSSYFELPIIAAEDRFDGAKHLVVGLAAGMDRVHYVNSGKTTLWNVTISNQADKKDTVTLDAVVPDGWKARFEPGARFHLGAGESITAGLRVTAPADGKEAETGRINVTAASSLSGDTRSALVVTAVITNGEAIPEPAFVADNETAARVATTETVKESPGAPALAFIGIALALLVAGRRVTAARAGRTRD